jgi:hypothetical protein
VRKLSRQAPAYICAYFAVYKSKESSEGDDGTTPVFTLQLIEHLVKAFKTHRAAVDFDAGFVNSFLRGIIANK